MIKTIKYAVVGLGITSLAVAMGAGANHAWGPYHWARTANPLMLKLGDNLTSNWDAYLSEASSDWNQSSVLGTTIVAGGTNAAKGRNTPKNCLPTSGRVEVCNAKYGSNGWLGIAQIWIADGEHIAQGAVKLNDTYFTTPTYNTPAWKRLVACQEVAHTFGLDHQDETFNNPNLGTCMDYTNDPDGGLGGAASDDLSNEHPNAHDFEELEAIYAHLDGFTSASAVTLQGANADVEGGNSPWAWGKVIARDGQGRPSLYARELGGGKKVLTHVFWAE